MSGIWIWQLWILTRSVDGICHHTQTAPLQPTMPRGITICTVHFRPATLPRPPPCIPSIRIARNNITAIGNFKVLLCAARRRTALRTIYVNKIYQSQAMTVYINRILVETRTVRTNTSARAVPSHVLVAVHSSGYPCWTIPGPAQISVGPWTSNKPPWLCLPWHLISPCVIEVRPSHSKTLLNCRWKINSIFHAFSPVYFYFYNLHLLSYQNITIYIKQPQQNAYFCSIP